MSQMMRKATNDQLELVKRIVKKVFPDKDIRVVKARPDGIWIRSFDMVVSPDEKTELADFIKTQRRKELKFRLYYIAKYLNDYLRTKNMDTTVTIDSKRYKDRELDEGKWRTVIIYQSMLTVLVTFDGVILENFKDVKNWRKTWLRRGIGVSGGGDYVGYIRGTYIAAYMSYRAIDKGGPAYFKYGTEDDWRWKVIPTDDVDDYVAD